MTASGAPDRVSWDTEGLLARLGGDAALAAECAEIFCIDAAHRLLALRKHCTAGDLRAATRQLHSLKGAASTAGAAAFQHSATEAELAVAAGDTATVFRCIDAMDMELARLQGAVLTFRLA